MSEVTLLIDDRNRVRTLTLDRPKALNAFNEVLYDATTEALRDAAADPDVAVVVITGSGRGFSAGQDLAEMQFGPPPIPASPRVSTVSQG